MAFCIWWRLSTGPPGRFWRGDCRTRWIRAFASRRSTKHWRGTARRKYSTPIRARSSPAPPSPAGSRLQASRFRWTDAVVSWAIFSSNACGARSNMKRWCAVNVIVRVFGRVRCFTEDGGRPLEVGLQEQASNRHELHWSRAIVVNVDGKGGARLRQVRFKETNGSKPLMTCRNISNDVETGTQTSVPRIKIEGSLSTAQSASGMEAA